MHDPAVTAFLALIERDIRRHPERLRDFPPALIDLGRELVGDLADFDIDAPIAGDVAI